MAEVSIRKMKDLATVDTLVSGVGVGVSLIGGEALGGALGGVFAVPETDILKTAGVKALGKIIFGGVGAVVATQHGAIGKFGVGMALGGIGGAIADIVAAGIQTTAPATTTGATVYSMAKRAVRPIRALPMRGAEGMVRGYAPYRGTLGNRGTLVNSTVATGQAVDVTSGLEIIPRD